ncbi:TonB-dependent siderophore receptor [Pseudomonas sp. 148P]|uniref:TonB-dependent siderophore receptor n=1 Tax=Pseudomonas ulcerans TaxID=3115852 RepID=A0ABU7HZF6_9PSED|nr:MULTISPECIES: TonB-dependent siderophore receptor [unclassified Pseudomonas]MEE1925329.1 TonB-dependent siderophore receptor [Pseudomonas sp. 147P]MEE1936783.1 TonB-dependent siderophore receptor [Pseudomonas sp. 148P]
MHNLIRRNALSLAIAMATGLGLPGVALASESTRTLHTFDIAAGPMNQVLTRFADQAGLRLVVASELLGGQQSAGLQGQFSVSDGVAQLLGRSGLQASISGDMLLIEKRQATGAALELDSTLIEGQGMGMGMATENTGSYTTERVSIGSKSPTSLRQTPQSVSVVTSQVIDEQRMTDLADAMKTTPGITVKNNNFRLSDFYARGFKIENIQIDGAAPMALGTTSGSFYSNKAYDMVEFDHVEVLRGSSALFGGTGDPGGMINLVRKRPLDTYQLKVDLSAGSWDNYRSQFDVTGPLGFDGKLRGRLVAAYTDRQFMQDDRATEKPILYGILEADILPDTRLTLGGRSERIHETGSGTGLPRYVTGADIGLPRSTSLTESWAYLDGRSQEVFAKIDHDFNDDWKGNVTYTQTLDSGFGKSAFNFGAVHPVTLDGPAWNGNVNQYRSDQKLWDANLAGTFAAFGLQHEFLMGIDYQKITSQWEGTMQSAGSGGPIDVFDPESTPWPMPVTNKDFYRDYSPNTQTQYGLYSTLRLQLAEPLHLILGARAQRYKFEQLYRARNNAGVWEVQSDIDTREPTKLVPYGGLVYDLNDDWSTYVSYSEIYKPQQNKLTGPLPGGSLEAMKGKTYETGIKGELWHGAVNASAALYYTTRDNEAVVDPAYTLTNVLFGGNCCYLPQGEVVSKGVDLELSGEVLPDWNVLAGYTYNHNRNRQSNTAFSSITPKHQFKLWTTWRMPGVLEDFKVGGGVNVQSANLVSGTASVIDPSTTTGLRSVTYDYRQGGYAVWNALVEYRIDDHWTLAYNANNLFDKTYYATLGSSMSGNWYGDERNHMLTLRGTFW